jgi:hypothetical protein
MHQILTCLSQNSSNIRVLFPEIKIGTVSMATAIRRLFSFGKPDGNIKIWVISRETGIGCFEMVAQLLYSSGFSHVTLYRQLLGYSVFVFSSDRKVPIKTATKLDQAYYEQFFSDRRTRRQYCE